MAKRYYWLKLKNDFFRGKHIKMLRKIAGGDTYTIIYLKMMLLSLENDGYINYDHISETPEEEVALVIDEEPDNVKVGINLLIKFGAIEVVEDDYYLPEVLENTGSETSSAGRMRRSRSALVYDKTSHCDIEKEKEKEKDIEKEKEKEIDPELEADVDGDIKQEADVDGPKSKKTRKRFKKPAPEEIRAYCDEKGLTIDPEMFYDYYEANGWKVGKNPMKSWKATLRNWHRRDQETARGKAPDTIGPYERLLMQEAGGNPFDIVEAEEVTTHDAE